MDTALLVTAVISAVIPWLTAVITRWDAASWLKAVVTLVLTSVTGVVSSWQLDPAYDWKHGVLFAFEGFIVAVGAHFGLWKPACISGSQGAIARALPSGIGKGGR